MTAPNDPATAPRHGLDLPASAIELREALRRGEVSAREVTAEFLGRIAARSDLGSFLAITAERATADAAAADERWAAARASGAPLPPLHGLPTAHKDLTDVAGVPTTHGSAALVATPAAADSPGVAQLRAAGAISLGKTQVPEFGLTGYSENKVAPPARNPHDPTRTPGGSSGGSAAAVAAGLLPVAPGSDGGGSIRIPALACGLIGLKPGLGAVPTDLARGAVDEFGAPRLTVSGPLAHTAADAALLFDAMRGAGLRAGSAPGQRAGAEPALAAVARADELRGLRIGVSTESPFAPAHPTPLSAHARAAHERAATLLDGLGHHVSDAAIAYDRRYPEAFALGWTAGLSLLELPEGAAGKLMPLTREFRDHARRRPRAAHLEAAAQLREFAADVRGQWGRYDMVLTPGLAMAPPRVGEFTSLSPDADYRLQCEWAPYTSMVNVSGLPAVAVPILQDAAGLPFGVQLIGRAGSEERLLQVAAQLTGS